MGLDAIPKLPLRFKQQRPALSGNIIFFAILGGISGWVLFFPPHLPVYSNGMWLPPIAVQFAGGFLFVVSAYIMIISASDFIRPKILFTFTEEGIKDVVAVSSIKKTALGLDVKSTKLPTILWSDIQDTKFLYGNDSTGEQTQVMVILKDPNKYHIVLATNEAGLDSEKVAELIKHFMTIAAAKEV